MMLIILVTIVKRIITHCLIMEIEINITLDISKASKEEKKVFLSGGSLYKSPNKGDYC